MQCYKNSGISTDMREGVLDTSLHNLYLDNKKASTVNAGYNEHRRLCCTPT